MSLFHAARGPIETVLGGDRTIDFVSASAGDAHLTHAEGDGNGERRLTELNAAVLDGMPLIMPEPLPFTAFDGRFQVDAWLPRPGGGTACADPPSAPKSEAIRITGSTAAGAIIASAAVIVPR